MEVMDPTFDNNSVTFHRPSVAQRFRDDDVRVVGHSVAPDCLQCLTERARHGITVALPEKSHVTMAACSREDWGHHICCYSRISLCLLWGSCG